MEAICEDTEYLKRYYCTKNSQEKNEVKDRLSLLKSNQHPRDRLLRHLPPPQIRIPYDGYTSKTGSLPEKAQTARKTKIIIIILILVKQRHLIPRSIVAKIWRVKSSRRSRLDPNIYRQMLRGK
jgi:hypothetical protein